MNAPQALYWYHQQPRQADYRNSSANRTGPYITELDMTGQPGVFKLVKYVPETEVEALKQQVLGIILQRDELLVAHHAIGIDLAAEREKVAQLLAALEAAKPPLELYQAYGWSDRAGVIAKVGTAIAAAKGGEQC